MSQQLPTNLTPKRQAFPFADAQTRYKSRGEILAMQEQWNTFERVENYDDVVYQLFEQGLRSYKYYVFQSDAEFRNYKAGQQLHIRTYTNLPCSTFDPISQRPMPDVPVRQAVSYETNVPRDFGTTPTPTSSEKAALQSDLEIYAYISSYNSVHRLKYQFVDDDEKTAYERANLRLNTTT
jgi:hypothetical protein